MSIKNTCGLALLTTTVILSACGEKQAETPTQVELPPQQEVIAIESAPEEAVVEDMKLILFSEQSITSVQEVTAIKQETREVTLKSDDGSSKVIVVGDAVENLDQVNTGDIVAINYSQSISVEVLSGTTITPMVSEVTAETRAEKGDMPAGGTIDTTVITATVEDINFENSTYKLKGPDGVVTEYVANNPENLTKANVGDSVIFTINQTLAVAVAKHELDNTPVTE